MPIYLDPSLKPQQQVGSAERNTLYSKFDAKYACYAISGRELSVAGKGFSSLGFYWPR